MIYSPSSTDLHLRCPLLRRYVSVEHWRPRVLGKRDLAAVLSTGVHAGLAHWLNPNEMNRDSEAVASREVQAELAHLEAHGCVWDKALERDVWMLPTRAGDLTSKVMCWDPQTPWLPRVIDTELRLPEYGDCRIDVVCEDEAGVFPLDWKVRGKLDSRYREKELAGFRRSRQMYHYAWALGESRGISVRRYAIGLIVVDPFSVEVLRYEIPTIQMQQWFNTSTERWREMEWIDTYSISGELPEASDNWTACETKYGLCDFHEACWDHFRDRQAMTLNYVQVPRRT